MLNKARGWFSTTELVTPDKVREEKSSEYAEYIVEDREGEMMLYGPIPQTKHSNFVLVK